MDYDSPKSESLVMGANVQPPLLEKLKKEHKALLDKAAQYESAIKALESNPEFETMINVLGKVTRIY